MHCSNLNIHVSSRPSISTKSSLFGSQFTPSHPPRGATRLANPPAVRCGIRDLRDRMESVKSTQKITEAMKLVAAARVRRAQEAVINGRPFTEALVKVLYEINEQLQFEDVDVPLTNVRPVRKVGLVVVTSDKGLCGSFNNAVLRKAEKRIKELREIGVECLVVSFGKKGNEYFRRREEVAVDRFYRGGSFPNVKEAQVIADNVFSMFVAEEVDRVEIVYSKFVSLIKSEPVVYTLLPLCPRGGVFDVNGNRVDAPEDEYFRLTTKGGKFAVERERVSVEKPEIMPLMEFEQDPVQILDALLPLYLNNLILRALLESLASELASRMNAMSNATNNAVDLRKSLAVAYNRERQAKITGEILELVAGADALTELD